MSTHLLTALVTLHSHCLYMNCLYIGMIPRRTCLTLMHFTCVLNTVDGYSMYIKTASKTSSLGLQHNFLNAFGSLLRLSLLFNYLNPNMKTTDDPEPYWLKEERERSREKESTPLLLKAEAKDVEAGTNQPSWLRETPSPDVPHTTPFNTENKSARKPLKWKAPEASAAKNSVDVEEDCCCCPRDPVLYYFYMYHFVTFLVGLFCIVANVSIIADSRSMWRDRIMHSYMCLFSVVVVAVEIDFRFLTSRLRLMELWLFRGLFYSFVGFGTVCASDPDAHSFYANAIGVLMCILGLGYACMEMFCLRSVLSERLQIRNLSQDPSHSRYTEIISDFSFSPMKL